MIKSTKNFLGGVCLKIKFGVIKIRNLALPAAIFVLSIAFALPVLNSEKADANAVFQHFIIKNPADFSAGF